MKPALLQTHDILGANSANGQGIADERAMTAPRHSFGAHQCNPVLLRELNQFFDLFLEFRVFRSVRSLMPCIGYEKGDRRTMGRHFLLLGPDCAYFFYHLRILLT